MAQFRLFSPIWQYHQTICRSHPNSLLVLKIAGADQFFGEPALDLNDFMQLDASGRGYINIRLQSSSFTKIILTFLIWMLSQGLFETPQRLGTESQIGLLLLMKRTF